jgi:hypothetical protein
LGKKEQGSGWSNCIFCGEPVEKADRSREHVLPMWMLRATGDPNRRIRIEIDPVTGQDVIRPASTFHFPACRGCNESYGTKLEAQAKKAMEALFAGKSLLLASGLARQGADWALASVQHSAQRVLPAKIQDRSAARKEGPDRNHQC